MSIRNPLLNGLALCCLTLAAASCAGEKEPAAETVAELKAKAAQALVAGDRRGDPCREHDWYADGECDGFCANADSDCSSEEPVACTLISEIANGVCGRPESDPCRFQDPDCLPGSIPPDPGGVACAAFIEESDGVCSRPADDPCKAQDPDCTSGGGDDPVVCALFIEESDGVCSRPAEDPCKSQDPDCVSGGETDPSCGVACAEFIEAPYGVCARPIDDPCKSQDPDCSTDPVVCALFIEAPDNQCSRFANDPCIAQDPDCRPVRH